MNDVTGGTFAHWSNPSSIIDFFRFDYQCQSWHTTLFYTIFSPSTELIAGGELSLETYRYEPQNPNSAGQNRTKRMRTSFKHHQLRTMKAYFNLNQNPDAKDLKQLAQKTQLSKRVLQVSS